MIEKKKGAYRTPQKGAEKKEGERKRKEKKKKGG